MDERRSQWCDECGHGEVIHPDGGACVDSRCRCCRFVEDRDHDRDMARLDALDPDYT